MCMRKRELENVNPQDFKLSLFIRSFYKNLLSVLSHKKKVPYICPFIKPEV